MVMTVTDPKIYTKPWTSDTKIFKLNREKTTAADPQVYCVPSEENEFNRLIRDGAAGRKQPYKGSFKEMTVVEFIGHFHSPD